MGKNRRIGSNIVQGGWIFVWMILGFGVIGSVFFLLGVVVLSTPLVILAEDQGPFFIGLVVVVPIGIVAAVVYLWTNEKVRKQLREIWKQMLRP
jgi:hypothetical protein